MDFSEFFRTFLPFIEAVPWLRAIIGGVLVFFLPGFAWTYLFFDKLSVIERIALSVGLSIALVTLSVIALNLILGLKINGSNALVTIVIITVIPAAIHFIRRWRARRKARAVN